MTLLQSSSALAPSLAIGRSAHLLTEVLAHADAPPQLIEEIRAFARRNLIILSSGNPRPARGECCQQCLKAHALAHAEKQRAPHLARIIHKTLRAKRGHQGYYLDGEKVRKMA